MKHWVTLLSGVLVVLSSGCSSSDGNEQPQQDVASSLDLAHGTDSLATDVKEAEQAVAATPNYTEDLQPIFTAFCGPCHTTNGSGSTNFGAFYSDALADADSCPGANVGTCGLERVLQGTMPPGKGCTGTPEQDAEKPGCLTANAITLYQAWLDAGLPE